MDRNSDVYEHVRAAIDLPSLIVAFGQPDFDDELPILDILSF